MRARLAGKAQQCCRVLLIFLGHSLALSYPGLSTGARVAKYHTGSNAFLREGSRSPLTLNQLCQTISSVRVHWMSRYFPKKCMFLCYCTQFGSSSATGKPHAAQYFSHAQTAVTCQTRRNCALPSLFYGLFTWME